MTVLRIVIPNVYDATKYKHAKGNWYVQAFKHNHVEYWTFTHNIDLRKYVGHECLVDTKGRFIKIIDKVEDVICL